MVKAKRHRDSCTLQQTLSAVPLAEKAAAIPTTRAAPSTSSISLPKVYGMYSHSSDSFRMISAGVGGSIAERWEGLTGADRARRPRRFDRLRCANLSLQASRTHDEKSSGVSLVRMFREVKASLISCKRESGNRIGTTLLPADMAFLQWGVIHPMIVTITIETSR